MRANEVFRNFFWMSAKARHNGPSLITQNHAAMSRSKIRKKKKKLFRDTLQKPAEFRTRLRVKSR